jgi:hypothetical protein
MTTISRHDSKLFMLAIIDGFIDEVYSDFSQTANYDKYAQYYDADYDKVLNCIQYLKDELT